MNHWTMFLRAYYKYVALTYFSSMNMHFIEIAFHYNNSGVLWKPLLRYIKIILCMTYLLMITSNLNYNAVNNDRNIIILIIMGYHLLVKLMNFAIHKFLWKIIKTYSNSWCIFFFLWLECVYDTIIYHLMFQTKVLIVIII